MNSITVGGSLFKDGQAPYTLAGSDEEETRDLFGRIANGGNGVPFIIPLNAGQTAVLSFDTENGVDAVIIDVTVAGRGSFTVV